MKASPLRGLIQRGLLSFVAAAWNGDALDELSRFPGGPHDDIVDAIACLARIFDKISPPATAPDPDAAREIPFAEYMVDPRTGVSNVRLDPLWEISDRERAWRRNRID